MNEKETPTGNEQLQEKFSQVIKQHENPDLVIAVLTNFYLSETGGYFLAAKLDRPKGEIAEITEFLSSHSLIPHDNDDDRVRRMGLEEFVKAYSPLIDEAKRFLDTVFGSHTLISREGLSAETATRVLDAIAELVVFRYDKAVYTPLGEILPLKEQTYSGIRQIRREEARFLRNYFGLSENETSDLSFVSERDVETIDKGHTVEVHVSANDLRPHEAFEKGYRRVHAYPRSDIKPRKQDWYIDCKIDILPWAIYYDSDAACLRMNNLRYHPMVREDSFAYMQEAKKKLEILTEIAKSIITQ